MQQSIERLRNQQWKKLDKSATGEERGRERGERRVGTLTAWFVDTALGTFGSVARRLIFVVAGNYAGSGLLVGVEGVGGIPVLRGERGWCVGRAMPAVRWGRGCGRGTREEEVLKRDLGARDTSGSAEYSL